VDKNGYGGLVESEENQSQCPWPLKMKINLSSSERLISKSAVNLWVIKTSRLELSLEIITAHTL
jgi:hypothetical protein